jgi:hypothetical protein
MVLGGLHWKLVVEFELGSYLSGVIPALHETKTELYWVFQNFLIVQKSLDYIKYGCTWDMQLMQNIKYTSVWYLQL